MLFEWCGCLEVSAPVFLCASTEAKQDQLVDYWIILSDESTELTDVSFYAQLSKCIVRVLGLINIYMNIYIWNLLIKV